MKEINYKLAIFNLVPLEEGRFESKFTSNDEHFKGDVVIPREYLAKFQQQVLDKKLDRESWYKIQDKDFSALKKRQAPKGL